MLKEWKFQIRLVLEFASLARHDPAAPELKHLTEILSDHGGNLRCQYDAFVDYVGEAEKKGFDDFPLYAWTKATIEDPEKQAKHIRSFAVYIDGDEVYPRNKATALETSLLPLVGGPIVSALSKHDTNPANNPQPPKELRR